MVRVTFIGNQFTDVGSGQEAGSAIFFARAKAQKINFSDNLNDGIGVGTFPH